MDKEIIQKVREAVSDILPEIVRFRHSVHSEPELGLDTFRTAEKIRTALKGTSIDAWDPLIGGDVVGELAGGGKHTVCLRADIDAVPVDEHSDLPYKSSHNGIMHACGHDGHAAILLGTALVLDRLKGALPVSVRFVFQPGEEMVAGGRKLVEAGVCSGCETVFAMHGWPGLPAGSVSARAGAMFAAGAEFTIAVNGKGCHGAMPENGINPIPITAELVQRLEQLHQEVSMEYGSVVSVCSIQSGSCANVIPDTAIILGTARYLSPDVGQHIEGAIRSIVDDIGLNRSVSIDFEFRSDYELPVVNERHCYEHIRNIASNYLPHGSWIEADASSMAMEDFAFYLSERPGAVFRLGLGQDSPGLHASTFDFNDNALGAGIIMLSLISLLHCE